MSYEFAIGKQVVCVDTNWISGGVPGMVYPVLNGVYTIRDIYQWSDTMISLVFEEISNDHSVLFKREHSFLTTHFRPVRKTDIGQFTSLLNDTPKTKEVKVMRPLETVR
jgi:hypothetical protein